MRKKISIAILVCMVALLSTVWIPAVHASTPGKKPIPVSGTWAWWADGFSFRFPGGNTIICATEHDTFAGTFAGVGEGPFTVTEHPTGFLTGRGRTVFTGTVDGKSGTLVIQWVGNTKNDLGWWWFMWVILSGTGELANLRGEGTAWGPGPAGVDYSGKMHFVPD